MRPLQSHLSRTIRKPPRAKLFQKQIGSEETGKCNIGASRAAKPTPIDCEIEKVST